MQLASSPLKSKQSKYPGRSLLSHLFDPEDRGPTFLRNTSNFHQTTWHHIPEKEYYSNSEQYVRLILCNTDRVNKIGYFKQDVTADNSVTALAELFTEQLMTAASATTRFTSRLLFSIIRVGQTTPILRLLKLFLLS
jgi:hypothetical protein